MLRIGPPLANLTYATWRDGRIGCGCLKKLHKHLDVQISLGLFGPRYDYTFRKYIFVTNQQLFMHIRLTNSPPAGRICVSLCSLLQEKQSLISFKSKTKLHMWELFGTRRETTTLFMNICQASHDWHWNSMVLCTSGFCLQAARGICIPFV